MKKLLFFAMAVLAMAACSNDSDEIATKVTNDKIDASKIQFNITVNNATDGAQTRGMKTGWENGDVVYLFFEGNTSQYVKMTYDGSKWAYQDRSGNTFYPGLSLTASGKKLSAVYLPLNTFNSGAYPLYDSSNGWYFGPDESVNGYILTAEAVEYTVTSIDDVTTLNATIDMKAPANLKNLVQVYIPTKDVTAPPANFKYVLNMTNMKCFCFKGIVPGGEATMTVLGTAFPLTSYHVTMGGENGYYFWGILDNTSAGSIDYNLQLVMQHMDRKYAISSLSKTVTGKELTGPKAIKLTGTWTDNGHFVSLGYPGSPLWATGNLDMTNSKIVDPTEAGEYFMYGKTEKYSNVSAYTETSAESELPTDKDVAYLTNNTWRMPTKAQFNELLNSNYTKADKDQWREGWTSIGTKKGGYLITSKINGISLFFAAAGNYWNGSLANQDGDTGGYWSSTSSGGDTGYYLSINNNTSPYYPTTNAASRAIGYPIRPVKNVP